MARFSAFFMGLVFAIGLGLSGMTLPSKVIGFLDVTGDWDPALAFVMGGALMVNALAWRLTQPRGRAWFGGDLSLPRNKQVDARLLIGAALFGIGWGVGGICPGPALTSLVFLSPGMVIFVITMTVGMFVGNLLRPAVTAAVDLVGQTISG